MEDSAPIIEYCTFINNVATLYGGAIYLNTDGDAVIRYCTFSANSAYYGGAIAVTSAEPIIENCTIHANGSNYGGGMSISGTSVASVVNTIISGTTSGGGILFGGSADITLTYSDFYENTGGHFMGITPSGLGILSGVNANGDSCDTYSNIYLNPYYADPLNLDFTLFSGSPCIDAGDPASPLDPDSTIADIGAFYFDQSAGSPVTVTLTPFNPPIQIPAGGGSFDYNIAVTVNEATPQTFDLWIMVTLPSGAQVGPVLGPVNATLPGGATVDRDRTQAVPANAPAGIYTYDGYVGVYPDDVWDEDYFDFEKLATGDGTSLIAEWECWGESLKELNRAMAHIPDEFRLIGAYPNPFNPATIISFSLPEAARVSLGIYDISGRMVAELVNGWRQAGTHEVVFDGTNLASGLYFCTINVKEYNQTEKIILIK